MNNEFRAESATLQELLDSGFTAWEIRKRVLSGAINRPKNGRYLAAGAPDHQLLVAKLGARITCHTAAKFYGLWTLPRSELHLWTPRESSNPPHSRKLLQQLPPRSDAVSVLDCVVHALRCLPEPEALAIAESAVILGRVHIDELLAALPGNRNGRLRTLVHRIVRASQSIMETIARYELEQAGLRVETQRKIPGIGHVDLFVEGILIVELDGFEFHSTRQTFREDRRRNNAALIAGLRYVRFTFEDLMQGLVVPTVLAALKAARSAQL